MFHQSLRVLRSGLGIIVDVITASNATQMAHMDNSSSDSTEYNDGSEHTVKLIVDSPGISRDACTGFKSSVKIHTNGNDTWKFNGRVTLFFDDGSNLVQSPEGITLKNDGATDHIP